MPGPALSFYILPKREATNTRYMTRTCMLSRRGYVLVKIQMQVDKKQREGNKKRRLCAKKYENLSKRECTYYRIKLGLEISK